MLFLSTFLAAAIHTPEELQLIHCDSTMVVNLTYFGQRPEKKRTRDAYFDRINGNKVDGLLSVGKMHRKLTRMLPYNDKGEWKPTGSIHPH